MKIRHLDLALGALFFGTLIGLGVVTVGLWDFALGETRLVEELYSPDVGYLRVGDPVLLHGMPTGKVQSIERLDGAVLIDAPWGEPVRCTIRIRVTLDTDLNHVLSADHAIYIEERGMLGGRLIRIDAGQKGGPWDPEMPLVAVSKGTLWEMATGILQENRYHLRETIRNLDEITTHTRQGRGFIGALLYDDVLVADLRRVSDTLSRSAEDIDAGRGLLGRLMKDETIYEEIRGLVTDGRRFINNIQDEFRAMREGDGVLAMLLEDKALADDIRNIVKQALSGIEDARESAPVQGIGSFLFGTF